jgi:2-polyprenyl-3-methyl-5-hydroxy-6-metoxy-1,4-benzoquinol methylase
MNIFAPTRRFDPNERELIDQPGLDVGLLGEELHLLAELNRRLGGYQLMLEYVKWLLGSTPAKSLSILDLGTGCADIPRAIVAWSRQRKLGVSVTAVDVNPKVLEIAEAHSRDWPEIQFARHDLRSLPYPPENFDIVLCSLALHHFISADAAAILRSIHGLARVGYIVNDLRRNWGAIWLTELLARTLVRSKIFQHDAPHSCRAAFTLRELENLAGQAGLGNYQIQRHHLCFRMVLAGKK